MRTTSLANLEPNTFWSHHAWPDFAELADKEHYLAVLPVFGLADHGLGVPLDGEEIVGSELLKRAVAHSKDAIGYRVLPPVRFALAPYPHAFFGIDPETAHALLREIAQSVQQAGFKKIVFFNTSPWNEELIDVASRDARADLGLHSFVINLSGLGLDFHPASDRRAQAQAAVVFLSGAAPEPKARPAEISDAGFRPGQYRQPDFLPPAELSGEEIVIEASLHLTRLFGEIAARAPLSHYTRSPQRRVAGKDLAAPPTSLAGGLFPAAYRSHYLPGFTRERLDALPDKEKYLVILPTGAIEQHGHHLPVGVDSLLGQAWLEQALPQLPAKARVVVAPPITYGKSNEHVGFPGTVFVSAQSLRRLLLAIAAQLKALGFRQLAILNTHGGNSAVLVYTLREIQTNLGMRAGMLNFPYKPDVSSQENEYGFHAGEWETSLMLAAHEDLVKMDRAVCEYPARIEDPGELRPENAPAIFSWISSDVSKSGVMGDATKASREKGQRWLQLAATALAQRIAELADSGR
jgi:creatinine amidohydrolase